MFRHPAWAVRSYSSGQPSAGTVGTKSTGVVTEQMCHPIFLSAKIRLMVVNSIPLSLQGLQGQQPFRVRGPCQEVHVLQPAAVPEGLPGRGLEGGSMCQVGGRNLTWVF